MQSDPAGRAGSASTASTHGVAPVSVADLAPGEHEVVLQADGGAAVQAARRHPGRRDLVGARAGRDRVAPGPVSGWLSVKAPVAMEIRENGRLIGTTDTDRIMLAAGRHELELVNDTLGYRATRVDPGAARQGRRRSRVELPQGVDQPERLAVGRGVGSTAAASARRRSATCRSPIGPHEVVFRHPQLGEKRQAVSVTLKAPVRLSVDMK